MTQLTWTSSSGSKGAIFAIDSAIAVTLAMIILAAAIYFATYSEGDPMTKLSLYNTAYDLSAVMDYKGYYDRFNETEITSFITSNLPSNMKMQLTLTVYPSSSSLTAGSTLSTNNSVIYGDRITTVNTDTAIARFAIWQ